MEKDEILANMYALRAGLSVVAINTDKVDKKIKKAKNEAKELEKAAREKKKKTEKKISSHNKKTAAARDELERLNEAKDAEKRNNANEAKRIGLNVFKVILVAIAMLVVFVGCAYCLVFWKAFYDLDQYNSIQNDIMLRLYGWAEGFIDAGGGWSTLLCFVVTLIAIAAAIGMIVLFFKMLFRIGIFRADKRTKNMRTEKAIDSDISYHNMMSGNLTEQLAEDDKDIEKAIADGKGIICDACAAVAPRAAETKKLYEALKETFNPFLDERDWDNLDLLTYYIETGRADTVKESLQLLDRQKQTDQIVSAVNEAAGAICRTVKQGLFNLQNDMRKCFNILADRIDDINSRVSAVSSQVSAVNSRMSSVESSLASQSAQIAGLSYSVDTFSSALAAKSNVSSPELVESVKTISSDLQYITEQQRIATRLRGY